MKSNKNGKGSGKADDKRRVVQEQKSESALKALANGKNLNVGCARSFYDGVLVHSLKYRCQTQVYRVLNNQKNKSSRDG